MITRTKAGGEIGVADTAVIQVSPQAPATRIEMPVKLVGFIKGEVRTTFV